MTSREIRRQFIEFFQHQHGHVFVPSSPVVPHDDPTLLFANAGMNQFKPYFLGASQPPWTRVANTQKCIRAGGKHNDLEDVGRSPRHHTFFEMLGNWSFGDYFKAGAIAMAWELLTKIWKLDPRRLHATVYAGNPAAGVPADEEAAQLWRDLAHLPADHIHRGGEDNFWEMGETGPCGPCTEIFIDRTEDFSGKNKINGDDPRVMELWNLVFIQYNRTAEGRLTPLPKQHVDTGLGLERICQVLQGCADNYGTDLFTELFGAIGELCGRTYGGLFPPPDPGETAPEADGKVARDIAFRVIADHIRGLTFALTDGATPDNEGRGYVLRRILRRAVRFGRQSLDLHEPFLHRLVPVVVDTMGEAFPELRQNPQRVADLIRGEEQSFIRTLDRGLELFETAAAEARASGAPRPALAAASAFKLHDTYGFPIDLTQLMARERGLDVDTAGYERLMAQAREKARAAGKATRGDLAGIPMDVLAQLAARGVPPTDDQPKYLGAPLPSQVAAIWNGRELTDAIDATEPGEVALVLTRTNFYAEMGGQVGDTGEIRSAAGAVFAVRDTQLAGAYVLHLGRPRVGTWRPGMDVNAVVGAARSDIEKNHTATHLLNWALRETLGEHVQQKGSLVDAEKLRFDFPHPQALQDAELQRVEAMVEDLIRRDLPVYTGVVPLEQGRRIYSLRAMFGEKYPPQVRVVSVGQPVERLCQDPANSGWRQYAIEFCGGTHLTRTSEALQFAILAEEAVSKGVRRIVALTGRAAQEARAEAEDSARRVAEAERAGPADLPSAIAVLQKISRQPGLPLRARRAAGRALARCQEGLKSQQKKGGATRASADGVAWDRLLGAVEAAGGVKLIVAQVPTGGAAELRGIMDALKKKCAPAPVAMLLASIEVERDKNDQPLPPKVNLLAAVSDGLVSKLAAGDWIKLVAPLVGGSGGGRPQMAMAGGKDASRLEAALETGRQWARGKLQFDATAKDC